MVTFSVFSKRKLPPTGSLRQRRMRYTLRRIAAAACAGFAVLFGLQAITAHIATAPVVVAVRDIARGGTIGASDVMIRYVSPSAVSASMLDSVEDATGRIAYTDIANGDPILKQMARNAPVAPKGTTVLEVRLTSTAGDLTPGDHVQLVSAVGCQSEQHSQNDEADTTDASRAAVQKESCVLAEDALVMGINKTADTSYTDGGQLVSFAIAPSAAAQVMQLQETGAIMAVMH
ncbi:SAF domain-containing protein [Bifidobacterium imperatoris]|uniref:Cation transport ATPase n=2 Tax=Bifidobacterium imperatoris TaxID=2020965 RepID=A0A2N5IT07_9BIFI|nr:SAF domain-containing protein [Bifidobacterium imperatoris]PLS25092.1 Cation transport ATPase [Bifidobacterium imperatoris]